MTSIHQSHVAWPNHIRCLVQILALITTSEKFIADETVRSPAVCLLYINKPFVCLLYINKPFVCLLYINKLFLGSSYPTHISLNLKIHSLVSTRTSSWCIPLVYVLLKISYESRLYRKPSDVLDHR